ncbi:MAG: hypothetical protein KatS3mg050_1845 [Litorilinea sp.]|nr:MAG: hypothetical protein KatS3mg050_1845 [Litorilinea sp.]
METLPKTRNFVAPYADGEQSAIVRRPTAEIVYPPHVPPALDTPGHTGHARQEDDALTQAKATLLVALAYIVAFAMITAGLMLIVWMFRGLGDSFAGYAYAGLLLWGVLALLALAINRRQGLRHSPPGIALREIEMRERVALTALQLHAQLLLKQMEGSHDRQ